jgi:hypothetical protein
VRRKSCTLHAASGTGLIPAAEAALARASNTALSSAVFAFDHPAKGVPTAPGSASAPLARLSAMARFASLASSGSKPLSRSRAGPLSGTMWTAPFLVRSPGMVQVAKSSETSPHVIPATSPRRWPGRISKRMIVHMATRRRRPPAIPRRFRRHSGLARVRRCFWHRQIGKRIGVHNAALHGPGEGGTPIGGRAAGHGGALELVRAVRSVARPRCKGVQGAHDGRPVQILCRTVLVARY